MIMNMKIKTIKNESKMLTDFLPCVNVSIDRNLVVIVTKLSTKTVALAGRHDKKHRFYRW